MPEKITEYTVRDYSAVDRQIDEIANRERVLTQRLQLANYRRMAILGAGIILAIGLFIIMLAIAYRIAFPKTPEIIETVKVVEKIVEPPDIIINTPPGVLSQSGVPSSQGSSLVRGPDAQNIINESEQRINNAGVSATSDDSVYATLSWDNFNDLDLIIREPSGNEIWYKKMQSNTRGKLDVDMNAGSRKTRAPVERISWPTGLVPAGKYDVQIMFYGRDNREPISGSTNYKLIISDGKTKRVLTGDFANNSPKKIKTTVYSFTVNP